MQPGAPQITPDTRPIIVNAQLMLISSWGREGIAICFAYKGDQNFHYVCLQPISGVITQDA